jgi:hypothetical protein
MTHRVEEINEAAQSEFYMVYLLGKNIYCSLFLDDFLWSSSELFSGSRRLGSNALSGNTRALIN